MPSKKRTYKILVIIPRIDHPFSLELHSTERIQDIIDGLIYH